MQAFDWMAYFPAADSGRSHDERAIGYSRATVRDYARIGEQLRGAHCRASFPEGWLVRIDQTKIKDAEVAHGAGSSADISKRISRGDEHDAQCTEFSLCGQGAPFYRTRTVGRRGREKLTRPIGSYTSARGTPRCNRYLRALASM